MIHTDEALINIAGENYTASFHDIFNEAKNPI